MRRNALTHTLIAATLILSGFAITQGAALAGPNDYRAGMAGLTPEIASWADEVAMTTDAALAKPEIACSAQMAELTLRGQSIAADLRGMASEAPAALAGAHSQVTASVIAMSQATAAACESSSAAAQAVQVQRSPMSRSLFRLRNFATRAFGGQG
jgi:hypothetical protein